MAAEEPRDREPPRQLWLDVPRPLQPRPRLSVAAVKPKPAADDPIVRQMELRIVPATPRAPLMPPRVAEEPEPPLAFAAWLVAQTKRPGTVGELAKAVKLDRLFPKAGGIEQVRARFAAAGADGDAYEALDDAEREFARLQLVD